MYSEKKLPELFFLRDKNKNLQKIILKEYAKITNTKDKTANEVLKESVFYHNCFTGMVEMIFQYDRSNIMLDRVCGGCIFYKKINIKKIKRII
jgi:hypothetical protein